MADDAKKPRVTWDTERKAQLRKLARAGLTGPLIAKIMGVSLTAVRGACDRFKVQITSTRYRELMQYLDHGGFLLREFCGGAVGERWTTAHRDVWRSAMCELLLEHGIIQPWHNGDAEHANTGQLYVRVPT
jgi:hypothetical protein